MNHGMTPRQLDLMVFVQGYIAKHGYSPNYKEIAAGIHIASKGNVARLVYSLEQRGYLRRLSRQARSLMLSDEGVAVAQKFGAAA